MMRTVWLAIISLALVSALAAGKALKPRADLTGVARLAEEATVGIGHAYAQDTLSKADRLEINYVRQEIPPQPVLQPTKPAVPAVTPPSPPMKSKIISQHWRDPNAISSSIKASKQTDETETNKKIKSVDRKRNQASDRFHMAEPAKPCRPGPFGDLLRSVNLSPACGS